MLRLRLSDVPALSDGAYEVRFLHARKSHDGAALALLFSLESPPYGLLEYHLRSLETDVVRGETAYGGGALEPLITALLGDDAPAPSESTLYLYDAASLRGKRCRVVIENGAVAGWESL